MHFHCSRISNNSDDLSCSIREERYCSCLSAEVALEYQSLILQGWSSCHWIPATLVTSLPSSALQHTSIKILLFIFRERGKEGEKEGEKNQCVVASCKTPTGDLACNPGLWPDWESNQQPFGSQVGTQSPEPHQPAQHVFKSSELHCF